MVNPELDCIFHLPVNDLCDSGCAGTLFLPASMRETWRICQTSRPGGQKVSPTTSFAQAARPHPGNASRQRNRHARTGRYDLKNFRQRGTGMPLPAPHMLMRKTRTNASAAWAMRPINNTLVLASAAVTKKFQVRCARNPGSGRARVCASGSHRARTEQAQQNLSPPVRCKLFPIWHDSSYSEAGPPRMRITLAWTPYEIGATRTGEGGASASTGAARWSRHYRARCRVRLSGFPRWPIAQK